MTYEELMDAAETVAKTAGPIIADALGEQLQELLSQAVAPAAPAPQSSVEIAQNAKGEARVMVKVYAADPDQAASTAARLYDQWTAYYAHGGQVPAGGEG
jgi:hypothetical protein